MAVVLDTHTAIWYFSDSSQLSSAALSAINGAIASSEDVYLSAISLVEVTYLVEKGRLPFSAREMLEDALNEADSSIVIAVVDEHVAKALAQISRSAIPDMPDRIIAATAAQLRVPLITRDRRIQASGIQTIW